MERVVPSARGLFCTYVRGSIEHTSVVFRVYGLTKLCVITDISITTVSLDTISSLAESLQTPCESQIARQVAPDEHACDARALQIAPHTIRGHGGSGTATKHNVDPGKAVSKLKLKFRPPPSSKLKFKG
eukprot:1732207-Prymnesium_polylepis.1